MKKNITKKEETIKDYSNDSKIEETEEVKVEKELPIELIAEKIKKEQGLKEVFITEMEGTDIKLIWRRLKRSEFKKIITDTYSENSDLAFYEKQDAFARAVILYPENVDEIIEEYAGIADYIASEMIAKTGFGLSRTKAV